MLFNKMTLFTAYIIANILVFHQVFCTFTLILVLFPFAITTFDNILSHFTSLRLKDLNVENIKYFSLFYSQTKLQTIRFKFAYKTTRLALIGLIMKRINKVFCQKQTFY